MSFWAWSPEPMLVASLAVLGSLTGQIVAAVTVRRGFDWRALLPSLLGARLYRCLSETGFRRLVLSLLTVSGLTLLASAVPQLLQRL